MECIASSAAISDPKLSSDLKTLALFVELYCRHKHADEPKELMSLRTHDVQRIADREISLCPQCTKLLAHAFVKRSHCPMNPKPPCKHCPTHCYHERYRDAMREIMRYSGRKMLLGGRLDYLFHLLF
jgi:hypothetical protein